MHQKQSKTSPIHIMHLVNNFESKMIAKQISNSVRFSKRLRHSKKTKRLAQVLIIDQHQACNKLNKGIIIHRPKRIYRGEGQ